MIRDAFDLTLVGEAEDGFTAVEMVREKRPNVLVTDLMITRLHGLEVVKQVRREMKATKVLVLSTHSDEPMVREALHNGANGYILKECSGSEFVDAVRAVAAGRRYMSAALSEQAIQHIVDGGKSEDADIYETLTSRERLVLRMAAEGKTTARVAEELFISPSTAETHRANLMRKLSLNSQTDLVRFAIRKGLIEP